MHRKNDYELLYLISQNNKAAENALLIKYNNLIWKNVNSVFNLYVPRGVEREDLYQEGSLALFNSFATYDSDRQVPFFTFANLCIERSMIGYVRKFSSMTSKQFYNSISLDSFISDDISLYYSDVLADINERSSLVKYNEAFGHVYLYSTVINDFEKNVLVLQVAGYSYKETSDLLRCSIKKIDNTLQKVKRMLN